MNNNNSNYDFPFYNYIPIKINTIGWVILLTFMFLSIFVLFTNFFNIFSDLVFVLLNITSYFIVTKTKIKELFKPIKLKDLLKVIKYTLITIIMAFIFSNIMIRFVPLSSNPMAISGGSNKDLLHFILLRVDNILQLFGEEFLAITPFLFILQISFNKFGLPRRKSIIIALLLSSIFFGLLHLPTYNWNLLQSMLLIGVVRVFLTLSYMETKNIFISFLVHFLYDTILFAVAYFL